MSANAYKVLALQKHLLCYKERYIMKHVLLFVSLLQTIKIKLLNVGSFDFQVDIKH